MKKLPQGRIHYIRKRPNGIIQAEIGIESRRPVKVESRGVRREQGEAHEDRWGMGGGLVPRGVRGPFGLPPLATSCRCHPLLRHWAQRSLAIDFPMKILRK